MPERITAAALLARAAALYDDPATGLAQAAARRRLWGFRSGGEWMRAALCALRAPSPAPGPGLASPPFRLLGLVKYGVAALGGLTAAAGRRRSPLRRVVLGAAAFYAIEAQMVFLFPLAIDGSPRPFTEGLRWTARAGGAAAVVPVVVEIAGAMLLGGPLGRGWVRSWCVGCLAVCLWYEALRTGEVP